MLFSWFQYQSFVLAFIPAFGFSPDVDSGIRMGALSEGCLWASGYRAESGNQRDSRGHFYLRGRYSTRRGLRLQALKPNAPHRNSLEVSNAATGRVAIVCGRDRPGRTRTCSQTVMSGRI